MQGTKLYQVLSKIPADRRKQFSLYLQSPLFNRRPRLAELLEILEATVLSSGLQFHSEVQIARLLYPDQAFDQNRFRKDCSALLKMLRDYLLLSELLADKGAQAKALLKAANTLMLDAQFPKFAAEADEMVDQAAMSQQSRQETRIALGLERYRFDMRQPARKSDVAIDDLIAWQQQAYWESKMQLCYMQLNHRLVTGNGQLRDDSAFIAEIAGHIEQLSAVGQMYYHLYCCTLQPADEPAFHAFKNLLFATQLQTAAQEELYTAALNYCARRINAGQNRFLEESFELYQDMLHKGILATDRNLLSSHFKNIVVLACKLLQFDWASAFTVQHAPHLLGEFNRNAQHFATGYISFCKGDFELAEPQLYKVLDDYEDVFYGVDARMTLLRLHYETQNLIGLESLMESFRMFVKRCATLHAQRKSHLERFIRMLRSLIRIPDFDKAKLQALREVIGTGPALAHRDWLLAKIGQRLA